MKIPRNKRVPFRVLVKYGLARPLQFNSFITDISDSGVYLKANKVFKPGAKLLMTIEVNGDSFDCEGTVSWSKKVLPGMERSLKSGMGIRFSLIPKELLSIYTEKLI
ncbi:MAG: PilZ domain-containing protein [Proteobacteria bacterium]|nr:PilZ domain-containing protein [Pseudomonadota bacterium]